MLLKKTIFPLLLLFASVLTPLFAQIVDSPEEQKAKNAMSAFLEAEKNKMLENYDEALKLYQRAVTIDPNYDPAMFEMARIYLQKQNFNEALHWVEQAWQIDHTNKWYGLLLADLYRNNYQIPEAIAVFDNLLTLEPNNTDYLMSLAGLYRLNQNFTDALDVLKKIERIDGISEETRFQMRNIYLQQNDIEANTQCMIELSNAYPEEEKYCNMVAEMYMQQNKPEEALLWYEKVRTINPNNPYIDITLADFYSKQGDVDKAYEYFREGYSNPNLDLDTKVQVLINYFEQNRISTIQRERAYELAEILVKTHPNEARAHAIYGDILYNDSSYAKAADEFIKVIQIDSTGYAVWWQLLYSLSMVNNDSMMAVYSKKAISLFPEQEFPYYVNAIANFQLEHIDQAIEALEQGIYFVSNTDLKEQFYMLLGDAYHQNKNTIKAYENYDKCLKLNPNNSFVLNNYAYYLSLENTDLEKAVAMAKKSVEIQPNENNLDTYGWVLYQMGDYEKALEYIQQSIDKTEKPSAVVLEHMGDVYEKLGDMKKARSWWKKALKEGGDAKILEEKISR